MLRAGEWRTREKGNVREENERERKKERVKGGGTNKRQKPNGDVTGDTVPNENLPER